jgi:hypothetical protein
MLLQSTAKPLSCLVFHKIAAPKSDYSITSKLIMIFRNGPGGDLEPTTARYEPGALPS